MTFRKIKLSSLQARLRRSNTTVRNHFIAMQRDIYWIKQRVNGLKQEISRLEYARTKGWMQSIASCRRTLEGDLNLLASIDYEIQLLLQVAENKDIYMRLKLEGLI